MPKTDLQLELEVCELYPLEILLGRLLPKLGYHESMVQNRWTARQHSTHGGFDIEAVTHRGGHAMKTVVKIVRGDVRLRNVDELVGVMNRMDADYGLIVATGKIVTKAVPLRNGKGRFSFAVLTGREFADLLASHGIGLCKGYRSQIVDYEYFKHLHIECNALVRYMKRRLRNRRGNE